MAHAITEAAVIDSELLDQTITAQIPAELTAFCKKEQINPKDVTSLRLDYKNILSIDNLWLYQNLRRLQLDNNIIERIENLHFLVHLEWLDLSYNNITAIQGLEKLGNLKDLTLYNNRIKTIEGLDGCPQLQFLNLGNNQITDLQQVSYLTRLKQLRIFVATGNPLADDERYPLFTLAHLNLLYLDFRLVDAASRTKARETYVDVLIALEEEEKSAEKRLQEQKAQRATRQVQDDAHIGGISTLFASLFGGDQDMHVLLAMEPEALRDLITDYGKRAEPLIAEITQLAFAKHTECQNERRLFDQALQEACLEADKKGQVAIARFIVFRKEQLFHYEYLVENQPTDADAALDRVRDAVMALSDELMEYEMTLSDRLDEVIKEFERNYADMASGIAESATALFTRLRDIEMEFQERLQEALLAAYDRWNKSDPDNVPQELRQLLADKDLLVTHMTSSHDGRLAHIDAQEDLLLSGTAKATDQMLQSIRDDEVLRNRNRVTEIILYTEKINHELEQL